MLSIIRKRLFSKKAIYPTLCILLAIIFTLSVGFTLAEWKIQNNTVNLISMGSVKGRILEEYEQGQIVNPSATVNKVVNVKNTGTIDANVRVKIKKAWGDNRDENGKLIVNTDLSTDNIIINYNKKDWYYNEEDGYFYFKGVLAPNEVTPSLLDSFVVEGSTTDSSYAGKTADIVVSMEIIQAGGDGISYWGMTPEELNIECNYSSGSDKVSKIDFWGSESGFRFNTDNGDLFYNFKNLVPGENRSQIVKITNKWENPVEIFLYADYADQKYDSPETLELIENLLKEYATIVISDENGNLIYSGSVWGNLDNNTMGVSSMKHLKSLGVFNGGETKRLNVSLFLDSQMDNEYQDLLGKVKWVVCAQGAATADESEMIQNDIPGDSVKTGRESALYIYFAVALLSALVLIALLYFKKEKKENDT